MRLRLTDFENKRAVWVKRNYCYNYTMNLQNRQTKNKFVIRLDSPVRKW